MKKLKNQSGFTLVELLITIMVIGIASVGIASLFYTIQSTQRQARYQDTATRAAQRQVELLRSSSYNTLTTGEDIIFTSNLPSSLPSKKTGIVTVTEPYTGVKRVDVSVTYIDNNKSNEVKLSSLIGVIGLSQ